MSVAVAVSPSHLAMGQIKYSITSSPASPLPSLRDSSFLQPARNEDKTERRWMTKCFAVWVYSPVYFGGLGFRVSLGRIPVANKHRAHFNAFPLGPRVQVNLFTWCRGSTTAMYCEKPDITPAILSTSKDSGEEF